MFNLLGSKIIRSYGIFLLTYISYQIKTYNGHFIGIQTVLELQGSLYKGATISMVNNETKYIFQFLEGSHQGRCHCGKANHRPTYNLKQSKTIAKQITVHGSEGGITNRIIGGSETTANEYPWQVRKSAKV